MPNGYSDIDKALGLDSEEEKAKGETQSMVRHSGAGEKAYKYLIESQEKSQLMDYLMRTIFANREEMLIFNDYVEWCDDFGVSLDNARRYVAARPAVDGLSRRQLVEALNTFRWLEGTSKKRTASDQKETRKMPE